MSKLTIHDWSNKKREVQFVGYNRVHSACFLRDEQNARRAITLCLPKAFDLRFRDDLIGKDGLPPTEINRAALHLPACFSSRKAKEAFDNPTSTEVQTAKIFRDDLWKAVTRHKCWLEPKDDKKLSKLRRDELNRLRRVQVIREKEIEDQIAALPPNETKRAEELRQMLRGEFTTFTRGQDGALKSISIFDTPLDMVRDGWGGLREKLLEQEWAEHYKLNLHSISEDAAAFHIWLEKHAYNARQRTTDMETRTVEIGVGLGLDPWQWEVLEAAVLYEVRFADGTRCWLDAIEERAVTDPHEVDDFDKLEEAATIEGDERMTIDEVRRALQTNYKRKAGSKTGPMSEKQLEKLCDKLRIPFKFPMRRSTVNRIEAHRKRQERTRAERLKRINAAKAGQKFP